MKIATLEYIHLLLQADEKTTQNALELARAARHDNEKASSFGLAKKTDELELAVKRARERHVRAAEALADFEAQQF